MMNNAIAEYENKLRKKLPNIEIPRVDIEYYGLTAFCINEIFSIIVMNFITALSGNTYRSKIIRYLDNVFPDWVNIKEDISYLTSPEHLTELLENRYYFRLILLIKSIPILSYKTYLAILTMQFDSFLIELLHSTYRINPAMFDINQMSISYEDIRNCSSETEIEDLVLNQWIDSMLRGSIKDKIIRLMNFYKIQFLELIPSLKIVFEMYSRRNLYVHNNGIVNKEYISKSREMKFPVDTEIKLGGLAPLSDEYFNKIVPHHISSRFSIVHLCWHKCSKKKLAIANLSLSEVMRDLVDYGGYESVILIFEAFNTYIDAIEEHLGKLELYSSIGWSYKQLSNETGLQILLQSKCLQNSEPHAQLIVAVLSESFSEAAEYMKLVNDEEKRIEKHYYQTWPVFGEFRKSEAFLTAYKKIFDEDFKFTMLDTLEI